MDEAQRGTGSLQGRARLPSSRLPAGRGVAQDSMASAADGASHPAALRMPLQDPSHALLCAAFFSLEAASRAALPHLGHRWPRGAMPRESAPGNDDDVFLDLSPPDEQ